MTEYDKLSKDEQSDANSWPDLALEDLPEKMQQACQRAGWATLMPVQARAMAAVMQRQDIMVQARTGSGKTGAFVLPLIESIDPEKNHCQALVLLPTRELAKQVADEAKMLSGGSVRTVAVYGGVGYGPQLDAFNKGAHLVVGTPGRILDHLMRGNLNLDQLDTLIFDEADRMLSIGFYPDMKRLQTYLPKRDINGLMFSATFPPMVLRLSEEFLNNPQFISLSEDYIHVAEVSHVYYQVPSMGKERALAKLIETENPSSALIFTNTKANCNFVAAVLGQFGYNADALSSDLSQSKREKVLGRIKSGQLKFLVATDVAARGIDIPELSHVFLYEPPEDRESYIHRSGRTGRAGAAGEVISLVDLMQKMELKRITTHYKIPLSERLLPEDSEVRRVVGQRTTALLEARLRDVQEAEQARLDCFLPLAKELTAKDDTLGWLAMLLDSFYHDSVHGKGAPARPVLDDETIANIETNGIDQDATGKTLGRKFKALKPLSRERMMKFMELARKLGQDDDGLAVLSLLLEEFHFAAVPKAPSKKEPFPAQKQESKKPGKESEQPEKKAPEANKPKIKNKIATEPADRSADNTENKPETKTTPAEQPAAEEKTEPKAFQPMPELLDTLRAIPPLTGKQKQAFETLAHELLADDEGLAVVALLLDKFDYDSRRKKPRKNPQARKNSDSDTRQPKQEKSAKLKRERPERDEKPAAGEKAEQKGREEQPQMREGIQGRADYYPPRPEGEAIKHKKRPRRRTRRKKPASG